MLTLYTSRPATGSLTGLFCKEYHIGKAFVGLILLPIVGNAVEHIVAVQQALKGNVELALSVAVGSAVQASPSLELCACNLSWAFTLIYGCADQYIRNPAHRCDRLVHGPPNVSLLSPAGSWHFHDQRHGHWTCSDTRKIELAVWFHVRYLLYSRRDRHLVRGRVSN